jgi:hypothetical protein
MERLYRGLVWLAGVTVVFGLVVSYTYASSIFNTTQGWNPVIGQGVSIVVFFQLLATQTLNMALSLANILVGGVIILAAALAWATRRRVWLAALIVATLLSILSQGVAFIWQTHYLATAPHSNAQVNSALQTIIFISWTIQLIPVILALIFGLTHRKLAEATAVSDAALGIERSAL